MICTYIYKGHNFKSELELNDFLLEKKVYFDKFGDIVFSRSTHSNQTISTLLSINESALQEKAKWEAIKKTYTEDGVRESMKPPYMGVNEFLDGLTNRDNKLFYPKYIAQNYWKERFNKWAIGEFTKDEIELFGLNKDNLPKIPIHSMLNDYKIDESWNEEKIESEFNKVTTHEQLRLRDLMENKWKNQALFGDIGHFIGQKLFSTIKSGPNEGKMWIDIVDENYDVFLKQIDPNKYDSEHKPIREIFTDNHIKLAITYFKNLKSKLENTLGDTNLTFITEIAAVGDVKTSVKNVNKLLGRIDLLVVDSKGNAHIVDYKTSPKPYTEYNSAKKLAYTYLLATYARILALNKIPYNKMRFFIAPILFKGFASDSNNLFTFNNFSEEALVEELTTFIRTSTNVIKNLDEIIPIEENLTVTAENLISNVDKQMKILFPSYGKKKTEDEIKELILSVDGFKKRTDLPQPYGYFPPGDNMEPILANSEIELILKVSDYYNAFQSKIKGLTVVIKNALKEGIKNNTIDVDIPSANKSDNPQWLRNTLNKYLNSNWEILEGEGYDSAEEYGLIFIQNKYTRHIEIVSISLNRLGYNPSKDPKMLNLTYGLGEADIIENQNPNSKMLKATNGNIRLMETLLVLNNLQFNDDIHISQIHIVNPFSVNDLKGTWAPNEQLLYSFNKLMRLAKSQNKDIGENNLINGSVKFATKTQLALFTLRNIINTTGTRSSDKFLGKESTISALDLFILTGNTEEILILLEDLKDFMENDKDLSPYLKNPSSTITMAPHIREAVTAYAQILLAIAECKGYSYSQQLQDHDKLMISLFEGVYWQAVENPGNYASNILNTASRVMLEAYQNVRDILSKEARKYNISVEQLKELEGYSKLKEYTVGNLSKLYDGIIYRADDGDLMVHNPWSSNWQLSESKREFTKMFLMEINKDRFPRKTKLELENMINNNDYDFFKLPLIPSSKSGRAAQRGIFDSFKQRVTRIVDPQYYKDKITNFVSEDDETEYKKTEDVFKMNNVMDTGNGPNRKAFLIKKLAKDPAYFEVDLENILLSHKQAYTIQRELDARMPIIKAAAFALKIMGDYLGIDFDYDYKTIEQTVKSKIKNESLIEGEKLKTIAGVTKDVQQAASWMALAFAPIQATGQTLNGIHNMIKLHWVYDNEIFSKEHLMESFKEVGGDIVHFGTTPTLCEAINRVFGINDMDMNTYAKNLSTNKHGIFHFMDRYAFKMSSRPDFYNRMTIFLSQMKADGCYEAVSIDKNGILQYDCKKDKRYSALWNNPKGSKEYNEALSRYITAAKLFIAEGAKNQDGSLFEFNLSKLQPLPRAYTIQEAESRKDVADSLYGYYDHTKKALFFGTYLGSLIGLMRTYWSAKKNLYFAPKNSNQIRGRHIQAKNDAGELLYYGINEYGETDPSILTTDSSGVPALQWLGDYAEGVIVTLMGIARDVWNNDDKSWNGIRNTIREKYTQNPNESYKRCYITNLKIAAFDSLAALLLGLLCFGLKSIYDDLDDNARKSEDLTDVILADAFGLVYRTFNYAKLDFFWWDSILSPTIDWNPFSFSYLTNVVELASEVITGDKNVFNAMAQSFGVARQNKPIFRYIAQQTEIFDNE